MGNGQGITIQIDADTGEALNKLTSFFGNLSAQIAALPKAAAGAAEGLGKIPNAVNAGTGALKQLREASMLTHEGFRSLEGTALLLGASRFPQLADGVMAATGAMRALRTAAMIAGVEIAAIAWPLALVGAAIVGGVLIWKHWSDETARAEENTRKMTESLMKLPAVIGNISTLVQTKLVPGATANSWLEKIGALPPTAQFSAFSPGAPPTMNQSPMFPGANAQLGPGGIRLPGYVQPDQMAAMQEELVKQGYLLKGGTKDKPEYTLNPQIEALQKLQELQKKVTEEGATGFDKERVKAKETYETALKEAEKFAAVAGHFFTGGDMDKLRKSIADAYQSKTVDINFQEEKEKDQKAEEAFQKRKEELAKDAAEQIAKLEQDLTLSELQEGQKRGDNYETEYQRRIRLAQELIYSGVIEEKEYTDYVEQATIKRLEGRRKEAEEAIRLEDAKSAARLAQIQGERNLIQRDPNKTDLEKAKELVVVLQRENAEIERQIELKRQLMNNPKTDDKTRIAAGRELSGLEKQHGSNQQEIGSAQASGTFGGEFSSAMVNLQNQWGSMAKQMASTFQTVFNSAVSSISSGISGLIMGTKTWGQALEQIGSTILTTIVNAIVEMGVRWIATLIMQAVVGDALATDQLGTIAPIASAASEIWSTPALLSAVATEGESVDDGLAALGIGTAAAKGIAAFSSGGYTGHGSPDQVAGLVHAGEFVFNAPTVQRIGVGTLQSIQDGGLVTGGGTAGGSGSGSSVQLHAWFSDQAMLAHIKANPGVEHHILDVVRKNKLQVGLSS